MRCISRSCPWENLFETRKANSEIVKLKRKEKYLQIDNWQGAYCAWGQILICIPVGKQIEMIKN